MRISVAIFTFFVFFEAVAPLVLPTRCIGAFRTDSWTVDRTGGSYGYVRHAGEGFVHFGPLGEVSFTIIERVALSALAAVAVALLASHVNDRKKETQEYGSTA